MNSLRDFNPLFRNLRSMASYSASVRRICIYRLWGSFSAIFILSFLFGVQGVSLLQAVYRNIQFFRNCNAEIPCLLGLSHALCAWLQFEPAALGFFHSPLVELERERLRLQYPLTYLPTNLKKRERNPQMFTESLQLKSLLLQTFRTLYRFIPNPIDVTSPIW